MCRMFEKIATDARTEGKAEGKVEGLLDAARKMIDAGVATLEQVAKSLDLSEDQKKALLARS